MAEAYPMKLFFFTLSIVYIAGIFLLAGSPLDRGLSEFNPYSLLHIPLYGILTILLILSFVPMTQLPDNLMTRYLIVSIIALVVAVADEICQVYVPGRNASATDVLLDLIGIAFALFLVHRIFVRKASSKPDDS